ncbi:DUF1572 family protein [candidate division KSB1 bacterium]|nr:DUF1572 family protein [candidate division KSB1 bacterium]
MKWTPNTTADSAARQFLAVSAWQLRDYNFPKLREAVNRLTYAELWQRPGSASNSIGNLLLHLNGNVRQHIIGGVGGGTQERARDAEFAADGGPSGEALLAKLEQTVNEAHEVLMNGDPAKLLERRTIQGKDVILMDDIFHVAEHFSYHTGQIIYIVKALRNEGFNWYKTLEQKTP